MGYEDLEKKKRKSRKPFTIYGVLEFSETVKLNIRKEQPIRPP